MAKRGRKRKNVAREANGRPSRQGQQAHTDELMHQRIRLVGKEQARNQRAGTVIGRLMLAKIITETQHDAGFRFALRYDRWARSIGSPGRWPQAMDASRIKGGMGTDDERALRLLHQEILSVCQSLTPTQRAAIETLVLDDVEPLVFRERPQAVAVLREALDVLADRYIMPQQRWRDSA